MTLRVCLKIVWSCMQINLKFRAVNFYEYIYIYNLYIYKYTYKYIYIYI